MSKVFVKWRKDIEDIKEKLQKKEIRIEHVPALIKRCPKCGNLSLEFDPKTGRIYCTKCGFEECIPIYK